MTQKTPLYNDHVALGGKMVDFAGWQLPVQYSNLKEEHEAVRTAAGLFDVSHMGRFVFTGPDALAAVQRLTTNDAAALTDGQAQYTLLLYENGTVVDDVIVYRVAADRFLMVVNAANVEKDFAWCTEHLAGDVRLVDESAADAMMALQGPKAAEILQPLTDIDLASVPFFGFRSGTIAGVADCIAARTGYTGEDGFELIVPTAQASTVWNALLEAGAPAGLKPAGLGCRDTLRLEMKFSLYGHEISDAINPLEAGLSWAVKLDAGDFIGRDALLAIKEQGLARKLVGFEMVERGIPREGYALLVDGAPAGVVTSGTMSPTLGKAIGVGFVPNGATKPGTEIQVDIRGAARLAKVVKTPFYKRNSAAGGTA